MDRLAYILEHGVYSQTAEDCDVTIGADGHMTGTCSFEGTLMRDALAIPIALPEESAVRQARVDGQAVTATQISPGIFSLPLPAPAVQGSSHSVVLEYDATFTDGVMHDSQGRMWLELQFMTVWKPALGFDPCGRTCSRGRLVLPRSHVVSVGVGRITSSADRDRTIIQWDSGSEACSGYSFIAGEGNWAQARRRGTGLQALTMRAVPYGTAELLHAADRLLDLYEDLWGPYPYAGLSIACPPTSISGNCSAEGLIIAGYVGNTSPATLKGFGILSHEVAHEWWGYSVRFNWAQLGLVEPLAAYGADRALRHYFPDEYVYPSCFEPALALAKEAEKHGVALIDCTWSTPASWYLRESKGLCVWRLLERLAGTERLDAALKEFAMSFGGRYVGADDIRAVFNAAVGDEGDQLFVDHVLGTKPIPTALDAYSV